MGDIEISVPPNHCIICSVPTFENVLQEPIPDRTGGSSSPTHLKLANAFIQCLTLDPVYAEDLTGSPFCLQCKLKLEEWDFCQNQMLRLRTRSRQLKAALTVKLLDSPEQAFPDSKLDPILRHIRQLVKSRFNPRVLLETTHIPLKNDDLVGKVKSQPCCQGTAVHNEAVKCQVKFIPFKLEVFDDEGGIVEDARMGSSSLELDVDLDFESTSPPQHNNAPNWRRANTPKWNTPTFKTDLIREVKPGYYLYRDKIPFFYKAKNFTCGQCKTVIVHAKRTGNSATFNMKRHLIRCERRHIPNGADELPQSNMEAPGKAKPTPEFRCDEIKNVEPGEYLYRDKIPFYYKDGRFTCGRCNAVIQGNPTTEKYMKQHLKFCETREVPLRKITKRSNVPKRKKASMPMFYTNLIQKVRPGEYVYRDKIPFFYRGNRFTCGRCKVVIGGADGMRIMKRHLIACESSEILGGPDMERSSSCTLTRVPEDKKATPTFQSKLITEVKPGEYLYNDKIPFYYQDKFFTCGRCKIVIGGRGGMYNMKRHLERCERRILSSNSEMCLRNSAEDMSTTSTEPPAADAENHDTCHICGQQFNGANSGMQCRNHITTSHLETLSLDPLLTAPSNTSAHNSPAICLKQSRSWGLPVTILVPSGQKLQNHVTGNNDCTEVESTIFKTENEDNNNGSAIELAVGTDDAGLIVPDIMGDEFEDLNRRVEDCVNVEMDPLQLMKIDFDCLEEEMGT